MYLLFANGWDFFASSLPANSLDLSGLTDPANDAYINWAGFLVLAIGDIVALDFMERVFAAKTPEVAQQGCFYGAGLTIITGLCC